MATWKKQRTRDWFPFPNAVVEHVRGRHALLCSLLFIRESTNEEQAVNQKNLGAPCCEVHGCSLCLVALEKHIQATLRGHSLFTIHTVPLQASTKASACKHAKEAVLTEVALERHFQNTTF